MSNWIIVVESARDVGQADTPHKVITAKDYLASAALFDDQRAKVINLARSYAYQSRGYYCSLLAEARGHRVVPTVEAVLELSSGPLHAHAIPELEVVLNHSATKLPGVTEEPFTLLVCFGRLEEAYFERFAREVFDWFRAPIIEVSVKADEKGQLRIAKLRQRSIDKLTDRQRGFFLAALAAHTRREWRDARTKKPADWSLAVLHNPDETLAPSTIGTLRHLAKVAEKMGVEVDPITRRDLPRLSEYDALFIRETTSIDNHTYRFARRAAQEGMPVIDDPRSMIRCTNKVYLNEALVKAGVPTPKTMILASVADLPKAADELGFPVVLKAPDSSYSRGVHKADSLATLTELAKRLFKETDLLIAQSFVPTTFDWRIGVLGGRPLYACRYHMARGHWQVIRHGAEGEAARSGGTDTVPIEDAPPDIVDASVRACALIGDGLYGVDIKETPDGPKLIEINDNPDLHHGWEDAAAKDELWRALIQWFIQRLES